MVFWGGTLSALSIRSNNAGIKNAQIMFGFGCVFVVSMETHYILQEFARQEE